MKSITSKVVVPVSGSVFGNPERISFLGTRNPEWIPFLKIEVSEFPLLGTRNPLRVPFPRIQNPLTVPFRETWEPIVTLCKKAVKDYVRSPLCLKMHKNEF